MIRSRAAWVMMTASLLALWGCSQNGAPANAAKTGRLQEEIQNLTAMRDHLRQDLRGAQDEKSRLQGQLDQMRQANVDLVKERDDLHGAVAARTAERDHTQAQFETLRKGVRSLMDQIDTMATEERSTTAAPAAATGTN
jgi:uncharacterized coiled-coil DUF342 family protein